MGMFHGRYREEFFGYEAAIEIQAAAEDASSLTPEFVVVKLTADETILFHRLKKKQDFHDLVNALRACGQACGWEFPQE